MAHLGPGWMLKQVHQSYRSMVTMAEITAHSSPSKHKSMYYFANEGHP